MRTDLLNNCNQEILADFCQKNHITKLSLFGSAVRGESSAQSDIDLLVEFHPEHTPGLITLAGMEIELSNILGKKVDLRTAQDLSTYFRNDVLSQAKVAYVEK
jgi:predicted nucleotidyltransferase